MHMCLSQGLTEVNGRLLHSWTILMEISGLQGAETSQKSSLSFLPCPLQKLVPPTCPLHWSHSLACVWPSSPTQASWAHDVMGGVWKGAPCYSQATTSRIRKLFPKGANSRIPFIVPHSPQAPISLLYLAWVNEAGVSPYSFVKIEKANKHNF